jgi:hypothetical protein
MADRKKKEELGDFEITFYEGVLKRRPDYVDALIPLAEAYTRKGLHEKGLEMDQRLAELCKEDPVVHYNLACSYALVGKKKEALKALRTSIEMGYCDFAHLRKDADLKSLHEDPEFQSMASLG